jgi:hypothetical protein
MDVKLRMSNNAYYFELYGSGKGVTFETGKENGATVSMISLGTTEIRKLVVFLQNELKALGEMELKDAILNENR